MSDDPRRLWTRVLRTAAGFGKKYGRWPTRVLLPPETSAALSEAFPDETWKDFAAQVELGVSQDRPRAEGSGEAHYTYGESLASRMTYTVAAPEPAWFALTPGGALAADEPDLKNRLAALGFDAGSDVGVAVQRAVLTMANQVLDGLDQVKGSDPLGALSAEVLSLVRHPQVLHELSAASYLRVMRAALKVAAAEFVAVLKARPQPALAPTHDVLNAAVALVEALGSRPLRLEALERIVVDPAETAPGGETLAEDLHELVQWGLALAVLERQSRGEQVANPA